MSKTMAAGMLIVLTGMMTLFIEAISTAPRYELRKAVVRKVVPDERGYIGHDYMTLIRYEDGFDTEAAGDRGEPGDEIMVYRKIGTRSLLGCGKSVSFFSEE